MTGYGLVQGKLGGKNVLIEAKSVNHKFFELNLRNSSRYSSYESKICDLAKTFFKRGRVDLSIRDQIGSGSQKLQSLDLHRLSFYHHELKKAGSFLKIPVEIKIEDLLNLPDIWVSSEEEDAEKIWQQLSDLLIKCFSSLEKMRAKEGTGIKNFFNQQLKELKKEMKEISILVKENVHYHQKQLKNRIQKLIDSHEVDEQRLAQEVAYLVDRMDVSEELQRFEHHIVHFAEIIKNKGAMGRKLDFLLQEMNREVNTLTSKSQSAAISRKIVECKHVLEKMREQVQNIE